MTDWLMCASCAFCQRSLRAVLPRPPWERHVAEGNKEPKHIMPVKRLGRGPNEPTRRSWATSADPCGRIAQASENFVPFRGGVVFGSGRDTCMAIPAFHQMFRPILALAATEQVTRQSATEAMAAHFGLTEEERNAHIPSGSTYVRHRVGWAMTGLTKAGLIEKVQPKVYRATEQGIAFLSAHPGIITVADLAPLPAFQEWTKTFKRNTESDEPDHDEGGSASTPLEALDGAISSLNADLRSRLLEAILKQSPAFFEQLVLDVLLAMGYGGSRGDAAQHLGKSGDEGIDGRINQDPLGLDQIMVQAKRYTPENTIDRKTIQAFIGSLAGQGVAKGIFITTSSFADSAHEFVLRGANTKVVLIDGTALLDLMMRHHIGVRVERQVEVLDLDQNYFSEDE
jgi:restriction system protein